MKTPARRDCATMTLPAAAVVPPMVLLEPPVMTDAVAAVADRERCRSEYRCR